MESKFDESIKQFDQKLQLPEKQLIILINPNKNKDMGDRLKLFLDHAIARGDDSKISALALVQGSNQIEVIDVKTQTALAFKGEEVNTYKPFVKKIKGIHPTKDSDSFDSILIIGAGVPNANRTAYKSINGINDVKKLIEPIEDILASYLKPNGIVRVQICHSNTCKDPDQTTTFAQKITKAAINTKNATLSAPESFSIISTNDARVFDVTTQTNAFEKMRVPCKKLLNRKYDDSEIQSKFMLYLNKAGHNKIIFKNVLQSVKLVNHNIEISFKEEDIKNALAEEKFLTTSKVSYMEEEKKMEIDKTSEHSLSDSIETNRGTKVRGNYAPSFFTNKETGLTPELNEKVAQEDTTSDKITLQEDKLDLDSFFSHDI
ncbi:hypothetical protein Lsan_0063 [Legionella santicrucis]|uniref:Uncharacterized protein n=1 Tax=Legionella santicrucis TaxID=45074 RepID=A0A0W0ZLF5_9GAMM|nr:hypothetical protein [Legionella santicrucis]KTD69979.1 hypothetical protein Lsan_0063 [Legionella santicrucis]